MKLATRIFLPILTLWLLVLPGLATAGAISTIRVGGTFYPVTAQGALGAATDIAMLAGRASPWVAGLTLAYQIGKFALEGLDSSNAVVPMNVLPANATQLPPSSASWSGWTYDTATKTWLPPSTAATVGAFRYGAAGQPTGATPLDACKAGLLWQYGTSYPNAVVVQSGANYQCYTQSGGYMASWIYPVTSCPTGYTLSGSTCNLSNASAVPYPSDNAPTIIAKADGTGFALDTRDPDGALAPATIPNVLTGTGTVNGQQTRVTIEPQTGGGLKVSTEQQITNADGSITTYKQSAITGADGKVASTTAANYPGGLADQTAQTVPLNPSTGDVSAVVNELQAQNAAAEAAKNAFHVPSGAPPSVTDLNLPTANPYNSTLPAAVASLPLPANDGGCYSLDVTLPYLGTFTISPCAIVNVVRPLVNYMVISIGVIGGLLVWLRSDSEAAA